MSGDDHGTTGELDLDAIEARYGDRRRSDDLLGYRARRDVPALVAEVRRLRALLETGGAEWSRMAEEYYRWKGLAEGRAEEIMRLSDVLEAHGIEP